MMRAAPISSSSTWIAPEITLWLNVIRLAAREYLTGIPEITRQIKSTEACRKRHAAKKYKNKPKKYAARLKRIKEMSISSLKSRQHNQMISLREFLFCETPEPCNMQWILTQTFLDPDSIAEQIRARLKTPGDWWVC